MKCKNCQFIKNVRAKGIELLPYRKMDEHKYEALNIYTESYIVPTDEHMKTYKELFRNQ